MRERRIILSVFTSNLTFGKGSTIQRQKFPNMNIPSGKVVVKVDLKSLIPYALVKAGQQVLINLGANQLHIMCANKPGHQASKCEERSNK